LARSRTGGRAGGRRPAAPRSTPPPVDASPSPSLAAATLPRVWQDVGYRPLADATRARALFDFAATAWPDAVAFGWGAWMATTAGERLVGALVAERAGTTAMLHGPVIDTRADSPTVGRDGAPTANKVDPLEIAGQLVAAAIDHAGALGTATLYTRPQGLDRVWIRFGFIPVPEVALPPALAGRPGAGLYAWRGGSALWTLREAMS
jgi:hypothetical protein